MINYAKHAITDDDKQAVLAVLDSDCITRGQRTVALEFLLCHVSGAKHAIAVSSGTTALELVYEASGLSAVTVPSITFLATANAAKASNSTAPGSGRRSGSLCL